LIISKKQVKQILEEVHMIFLLRTIVNKTLEKTQRRFYWTIYKQDVEDWCKSCKIYVAKKGPVGKGIFTTSEKRIFTIMSMLHLRAFRHSSFINNFFRK